MTDERYRPESTGDEPPLHLRENAERLPLYEELSAVLQNVLAIRYPGADPEEKEAVKRVINSDTRELVLPKIVTGSHSRTSRTDDIPPRVKERQQEKRKEQIVRDTFERYGRRS